MRILTLCTLFLLTVTLAHAQDATPEAAAGWTIEQRCVGEPTTPPDDWSFDGTILMTGYAGIHGVNAVSETPFVAAFFSGRELPAGGVLSPDARWYATPEGTRVDFFRDDRGYTTDAITNLRVYSTVTLRESYIVDWQNSYTSDFNFYNQLYWYDNTHLLYARNSDDDTRAWFLIDPFTTETIAWDGALDPAWLNLNPSPDWQSATYNTATAQFDMLLWNDATTTPFPFPIWIKSRVWKPDSAQFAFFTIKQVEDRPYPDQLIIVNRDGSLAETVYQTDANMAGVSNWSPDGHWLAFFTESHLFIADTQERVVVDTCIDFGNSGLSLSYSAMLWSPDSTQFAMLDARESDGALQILDMTSFERYVVAHHTGEIIGWRADD